MFLMPVVMRVVVTSPVDVSALDDDDAVAVEEEDDALFDLDVLFFLPDDTVPLAESEAFPAGLLLDIPVLLARTASYSRKHSSAVVLLLRRVVLLMLCK